MEQSASSYRLFISNNCRGCEYVLEKLRLLNITIAIINIDKEDTNLPFSLMITPALVKDDDKLVGYGPDIVNYLKRNYIKR